MGFSPLWKPIAIAESLEGLVGEPSQIAPYRGDTLTASPELYGKLFSREPVAMDRSSELARQAA